MSEEYGNDYIAVTDEDGNEFELEHLDTIEYEGTLYMAFLPANMDEDDDDYGLVILKVEESDGEEILATVDDQREQDAVYEVFMSQLFNEDGEGADVSNP